MKKYLFLLILMAQAFAWNVVHAAELPPAEQLNTLLASTHALEAKFSQEVSNKNPGAVSKMYAGNFYMQRPNKFRWHIQSPSEQVIVADGKKLWVYDIDLQQVTVQPLSKQLGDTPALLLSGGSDALSKTFNVKIGQGTKDALWFELTPKDEHSMIQHVSLGFRQNQLHYMILTDGTGQESHLTFSDVVLNPSLKKELFVFTLPKGVDVVGDKN